MKSLIEPNDNEMIAQVNARTQTQDFIFQIDANFDRILSIIDSDSTKVKDEIENNRRLERIARRQRFADLEVQTGNRSPYAATRNFFNMITPNPRR
jgi:hypothetical protein